MQLSNAHSVIPNSLAVKAISPTPSDVVSLSQSTSSSNPLSLLLTSQSRVFSVASVFPVAKELVKLAFTLSLTSLLST